MGGVTKGGGMRPLCTLWKLSKELAKDKNAWKSFIKASLTHACVELITCTKYDNDDELEIRKKF